MHTSRPAKTVVLVTGAAGMLARALVPILTTAGYRVVTTDIDLRERQPWGDGGPEIFALDVRSPIAVRQAIDTIRPNVVLHLAAETNLEVCETNPNHAIRTNATATRTVAERCREHGIRMVYVSTAGVFDGTQDIPYTEADRPRPINWYGRSKATGEEHVADLLTDFYIVRAGWMVGGPRAKDHKFVGRIVNQLRDGRRVINAVGDKFGSPTYAPDFGLTLLPILRGELPAGLYHSVSESRRSRYQIACEIIAALDRDDVEVREVDSAYFAQDFFAPRPRSEVLRNENLRGHGQNTMRPWPEPLYDYLAPWQSEIGLKTSVV